MSTAKIEIKIGGLHFSGEGEQEWIGAQLDKIIAKADVLGALSEKHEIPAQGQSSALAATSNVPALGTFLNSKGATTNQTKKFLATAAWLYLKGTKKPTTSDVTGALRDNHQSKLNNASQNLNDNVKQGLCEKNGNEFFITDEGFKELNMTRP